MPSVLTDAYYCSTYQQTIFNIWNHEMNRIIKSFTLLITVTLSLACDEPAKTNYQQDNPLTYYLILISFLLIPFLSIAILWFKILRNKLILHFNATNIILLAFLLFTIFLNFLGVSIIYEEMHCFSSFSKNNIGTECIIYYVGVLMQIGLIYYFYKNVKSDQQALITPHTSQC